MPGEGVIGDFSAILVRSLAFASSYARHCEGTLRGIAKCRYSSVTTALIAVTEVKPFEEGWKRAMFREEDSILSNPVSETKTDKTA
ncbi:hypothetical protein AVEN_117227-1 [Araneus ventricosus]|uniref:Uncharacterized protein n=1 Tax=Araneus ventricosus TaxID=182803 RepID=A0A4Y2AY51_ARAVE|nr:hypothetical protein AVEN_117227-1 [Araneus ventricosus]